MSLRNLVIVLGDQLDQESSALVSFDPANDQIWMAETPQEATHVWCHKIRMVFFFSCMRHFAGWIQKKQKWPISYHELTANSDSDRGETFTEILSHDIKKLKPQKLVLVPPGDHRVQTEIEQAAKEHDVPIEYRPDQHFLVTPEAFQEWSDGKKSLVLEHFYRWLRKSENILLDKDKKPVGGQWNFDQDNRKSFSKTGPPEPIERKVFPPDKITRQVMKMVDERFADHPGDTKTFDYPVTAAQAEEALIEFVQNRLARFGEFQDAMWTDDHVLYHSRISAVMNVKLLNPRMAIHVAIGAYETGAAPLNSVEGFVRQVIGWREFIRGIYYQFMPEYLERNELGCEDMDVPASYWDGQSRMNCVRNAMQSVMEQAYGHHIHRLMVLGLFSQLLGVHPRKFHDWHMAMYADAIDWVSLPNTLGMSQFGDGGVVGTKPYCASGNYINKMSNYCKDCEFNFKQAHGEKACPVTTMYWSFLDRHHERFTNNRRMLFQIKNLEKKSEEDMDLIRQHAQTIVAKVKKGERI